MSKLGFYMWAYANVESVDYIFDRLRKVYPESEIYLSSDNGEDFSFMIEKYGLTYEHSKESHGPATKPHRYGWTATEAKLWLDRIYNACQTLSTDYIMLMEEDILVKDKVRFPAVDIIMIPGWYNPICEDAMKWIGERGGKTDYPYYSAGGGTIIKRDTFIRAYDNWMSDFMRDYEDLYNKSMNAGCNGWGWNDSILAVLFYLENAKISTNLPITESGDEDANMPIIHKFKRLYRQKS